jgi:Icc-related predicted phosphoesterase
MARMTTEIFAISDLHLDMSRKIPTLPGGDVLVLPGDITEARNIKKFDDAKYAEMRGMEYSKLTVKERVAKFLREECSEKYNHIVYVAGNHEHYRNTYQKTINHIKENVPYNFHVLEKDAFIVKDVMFLGGTLWTDMNRGDPITRQVVKYGMNDFKYIRRERNGDYIKFSPADAEAEHHATLTYFRTMLTLPTMCDKKVVIVTHHAPTGQSTAPQYLSDFAMNGAYHSRLDDFILDHPQIQLWFHGHTHHKFDYMAGDFTRVICNPYGYHMSGFDEETGWDPGLKFTV